MTFFAILFFKWRPSNDLIGPMLEGGRPLTQKVEKRLLEELLHYKKKRKRLAGNITREHILRKNAWAKL